MAVEKMTEQQFAKQLKSGTVFHVMSKLEASSIERLEYILTPEDSQNAIVMKGNNKIGFFIIKPSDFSQFCFILYFITYNYIKYIKKIKSKINGKKDSSTTFYVGGKHKTYLEPCAFPT